MLSIRLSFHGRKQQGTIKRIYDAVEQGTTRLASQRVALESMTVEMQPARQAKQKLRVAFWTFDLALPRGFFRFGGHHAKNP